MNTFEHELVKGTKSKQNLAVALQQLGLLNQLLQQDTVSEVAQLNDISEICHNLDHICQLTHRVTHQVERLYRQVSICYQLPN